MTLEMMNQLAAEYPECFKALKHSRPPFLPIQYGIDVDKGWDGLVKNLLNNLEAEIKKLPNEERENTYVFQIKSKFGGLRCYMSQDNEYIYNLIHNAEVLSYKTCEKCSAAAEQQTKRGWIHTLCNNCFKDLR